VVVATGTRPKKVRGLQIPDELEGRIFYEVYPLVECHNKKIAIIGAGDAAFDYALNMARSNEVVIVNRSDSARCIPVLWKRCEETGNITYVSNVVVEAVSEAAGHIVIRGDHARERKKYELMVDYVIIAIGREPCVDTLQDLSKEQIEKSTQAKKLYRIGDVTNERYRHTGICVGDGIKAAMEIYERSQRGLP
jgi:thioredoxin reductase